MHIKTICQRNLNYSLNFVILLKVLNIRIHLINPLSHPILFTSRVHSPKCDH